MIKVTCNRGKIEATLDGSGLALLSELCVIVDSVCDSVAKEIDSSYSYKNMLIEEVANALLARVKREKVNK